MQSGSNKYSRYNFNNYKTKIIIKQNKQKDNFLL